MRENENNSTHRWWKPQAASRGDRIDEQRRVSDEPLPKPYPAAVAPELFMP